ncbi:MAG: tRNA lysidine(34) synthetase TilS [Polyangiales bacterium]
MLISRVRRTIETRALITRGSVVVCACSGGPDSAALLACLARLADELGFALHAASVDHGLRPEAAADVRIAQRQAEHVGVPFHALAIAVPAGGSLQARARELRYAALAELAQRLGAARIAVGHTQDDQAETVLARMLRGAGLWGLAAISPRRSDGVVRPLIDCRRSDVHQFARRSFTALAEDLSNVNPRFERVRIRSHVVPTLEMEDRALVRHLAQLAEDARDCMALVDTLAEALLGQCMTGAETLEISELVSQPATLRRAVLRQFVDRSTGLPIGRAELAQLDQVLCRDRGEVWLSAGYSVHASGGGLLRVRERISRTGQNG